MGRILNALTIDVEDYYMVSAFEPMVPKEQWPRMESRVEKNTRLVLEILRDASVKATFFALGWIAERHPGLMREIAAEGHELACHGFDHRLVYDQSPEEFRADVRRAKEALKKGSGAEVIGYRAPSFSITPRSAWALNILAEEGFLYDASLMPASHARGGMPGVEKAPHRRGPLAEFPMSVLSFLGKDLPFSGGGYFRLFPYALIRRGFEALNRRDRPGITYFHPWEFDPGQPRMRAPFASRFKHYVNLDRTGDKLKRLLKDFSFAPARQVLAEAGHLEGGSPQPS